MQFIGGPMHGHSAPEEPLRFVNAMGQEILPLRLLRQDAQGCLDVAYEVYVKCPYFRLGKPLIYFYAHADLSEDDRIIQARQHFGL